MHGNLHDLIVDIKISQATGAAEIEAFRKIAWLTHPMLIPIATYNPYGYGSYGYNYGYSAPVVPIPGPMFRGGGVRRI